MPPYFVTAATLNPFEKERERECVYTRYAQKPHNRARPKSRYLFFFITNLSPTTTCKRTVQRQKPLTMPPTIGLLGRRWEGWSGGRVGRGCGPQMHVCTYLCE